MAKSASASETSTTMTADQLADRVIENPRTAPTVAGAGVEFADLMDALLQRTNTETVERVAGYGLRLAGADRLMFAAAMVGFVGHGGSVHRVLFRTDASGRRDSLRPAPASAGLDLVRVVEWHRSAAARGEGEAVHMSERLAALQRDLAERRERWPEPEPEPVVAGEGEAMDTGDGGEQGEPRRMPRRKRST